MKHWLKRLRGDHHSNELARQILREIGLLREVVEENRTDAADFRADLIADLRLAASRVGGSPQSRAPGVGSTDSSFIEDSIVPWMASAPWRDRDRVLRLLKSSLASDNSYRFGTTRTRNLVERYRRLSEYGSIVDADVLELGAGLVHPMDASMVFYLNGARSAVAADIDYPKDVALAAEASYDLLSECLINFEDWFWGEIALDEFLNRAYSFDREALASGDLFLGISDTGCVHEHVDKVMQMENRFHFVVSNSVLEHIHDLDETMSGLARVVRPGGFMLHNIDMKDHRRRRWGNEAHGGLSRWYFLTSNDDHSRSHCNRVRISEYEELFSRHGFEVVDRDTTEVEPPESLRGKLLPEFSHLSSRDLRTIEARFSLRKA